jgi:hypothetical protein
MRLEILSSINLTQKLLEHELKGPKEMEQRDKTKEQGESSPTPTLKVNHRDSKTETKANKKGPKET